MSILVGADRAVDAVLSPVEAALGQLDAAIDGLAALIDDALSPAACERSLAALERHTRRTAGLRLKVLAAAQRQQVAQGAGFAKTEAWVARRTSSSRVGAAREVALADELTGGHDATVAALDHGELSTAHAQVIVGATRQLPDGVTREQRTAVEQRLVAEAQRLDPEQLRRRARRVLETIEPDQRVVDAHENELVRTEEEAAWERCALTLHDNGDGTTTGRFTVPTVGAAILRTITEAMISPRRVRSAGPRGDSAQPPATPDWRRRRGIAFAELLEHLPTDHLHPKTAATVVVTVDYSVLTGALKVAGLDTGEVVSAGQARRLACEAALIPAVLGRASVALDLGRESRLFSEAQRVATGLRFDSCAADGCDRPFAWCELHHRSPWSTGGRTDLRDAVPLCHWHHQRIHDHHYVHAFLPDGSVRFRRRA